MEPEFGKVLVSDERETMAKTYHIGEIMDLFDVDPAGAWDLVLDRGWEHVQPLPNTKWQITIPDDELPRR